MATEKAGPIIWDRDGKQIDWCNLHTGDIVCLTLNAAADSYDPSIIGRLYIPGDGDFKLKPDGIEIEVPYAIEDQGNGKACLFEKAKWSIGYLSVIEVLALRDTPAAESILQTHGRMVVLHQDLREGVKRIRRDMDLL